MTPSAPCGRCRSRRARPRRPPADSRVGAQQRDGRPGAGHQAAQRAGRHSGAQRPTQAPGCSEIAAACRSLPSRGDHGRVAAGQRGQNIGHRPTRGGSDPRPAAGPARRRRRRWTTPRRRAPAPSAAVCAPAPATSRSPRPVPTAVPPVSANGTSAPMFGADIGEFARGRVPAPTARHNPPERPPRRRCRRPSRRQPGSAWRSRWPPAAGAGCVWPAVSPRPGQVPGPGRHAVRRVGADRSAGRRTAMVTSSARSTAWKTVTRSW